MENLEETTEMDVNHPLIEKLLSLNLPPEDYAVFGSGPMFAHGLKDLGHDLDLVARRKAWDQASTYSAPVTTKSGDGQVIELFSHETEAGKTEAEIEIFDSWAPGEWDINALIDAAEEIGGIRFVQLEAVLAWKKAKNREKDIEHIRLIEEYLAKTRKS